MKFGLGSSAGMATRQQPTAQRDTLSVMGGRDDDAVEVIVALDARFAASLRTMSASIGAEAGFSVDEIDDFKLALSEAFSMLVDQHAGKRVRTSFGVSDAELVARLSLESGAAIDIEPDELGLAIMRAVVDWYEIGDSAITLRKRAVETSRAG